MASSSNTLSCESSHQSDRTFLLLDPELLWFFVGFFPSLICMLNRTVHLSILYFSFSLGFDLVIIMSVKILFSSKGKYTLMFSALIWVDLLP